MRIYATNELAWKGDRLLGGNQHVELVPDSKWPGMWRVKRPDGTLTDMANHTWAPDAAKPILLSILTSQETAPGASTAFLLVRTKIDQPLSVRAPSGLLNRTTSLEFRSVVCRRG